MTYSYQYNPIQFMYVRTRRNQSKYDRIADFDHQSIVFD